VAAYGELSIAAVNAIETRLREREILSVRLDPGHFDARLSGATARVLKQLAVTSTPTTSVGAARPELATVPPVPVPTSSSVIPGSTPIRSSTSVPTGLIRREKPFQSPAPQVGRIRWRNSSAELTQLSELSDNRPQVRQDDGGGVRRETPGRSAVAA
jgi:hypothetical protein